MTTAVVVATVVTTDLNEANCKHRLLEQIRRNDNDLRTQLTHEDRSANVVTAILNIEEFMEYVQEWSRRHQQPEKSIETTVVTDGMSEFEFMEHTLEQLRSNGTTASAALSDEMLAAMEDESIGEDFARFPFRY